MNAEPPPTERARRRGILTAGGFAHFIHDGFTDTVYVLLPLWASVFGLSHAQVGLLKACMSVGLAALQVQAGYLAERLGERTVLIAGTVLTGAAFVGMAFANGVLGLAVLLFIAGVGASTQHPLASALVSKAFEDGRRRAALGTYNFCGDLGKIAMPAGVAGIAALYGWQEGSAALGVLGIVAAGGLYVVLRRLGGGGRPDRRPASAAAEGPRQAGWGIHDRRGFSALAAISMIDSA
ncbi:MAG: MFS transporter, partial [Magnetovibrio sp.]|nr:MFS transporter [Magnetovibrio sp.]